MLGQDSELDFMYKAPPGYESKQKPSDTQSNAIPAMSIPNYQTEPIEDKKPIHKATTAKELEERFPHLKGAPKEAGYANNIAVNVKPLGLEVRNVSRWDLLSTAHLNLCRRYDVRGVVTGATLRAIVSAQWKITIREVRCWPTRVITTPIKPTPLDDFHKNYEDPMSTMQNSFKSSSLVLKSTLQSDQFGKSVSTRCDAAWYWPLWLDQQRLHVDARRRRRGRRGPRSSISQLADEETEENVVEVSKINLCGPLLASNSSSGG